MLEIFAYYYLIITPKYSFVCHCRWGDALSGSWPTLHVSFLLVFLRKQTNIAELTQYRWNWHGQPNRCAQCDGWQARRLPRTDLVQQRPAGRRTQPLPGRHQLQRRWFQHFLLLPGKCHLTWFCIATNAMLIWAFNDARAYYKESRNKESSRTFVSIVSRTVVVVTGIELRCTHPSRIRSIYDFSWYKRWPASCYLLYKAIQIKIERSDS